MNIYFATPISKHIIEETGKMDDKTIELINLIYKKIKMKIDNCKVFLAAKEEKWGEVKITDEYCAIRDFNAIKNADHVIAILFEEMSDGVLVELGWASALGIPISLVIGENMNLSKLVRGIQYITECQISRINWDGHLNQIDCVIEKITSMDNKNMNNEELIKEFLACWEENKIKSIEPILSDDVILSHPYFKKEIVGINNVISNLAIINLDYKGQSDIFDIKEKVDGIVTVKIRETPENGGKGQISQYVVVEFTIIDKIKKIEFIGMELVMSSEYITEHQKYHAEHDIGEATNTDIIKMLVDSWSENNRNGFISLFTSDAEIHHPLYINVLSPVMFFELMNSTVDVTSKISSIEPINGSDSMDGNRYLVRVLEMPKRIENSVVGEMMLEVEFNSSRIKSILVEGYAKV